MKIYPIKGYESFYGITKNGDVLNLRRNKFLKHSIRKGPYKGVCLSVGGVKKAKTIHRLLAQTFLKNYSEKLEVNHKDCDKLNNKLSNIEMATRLQNYNHAKANGKMDNLKIAGARASFNKRKLTKKTRKMINELYQPYGYWNFERLSKVFKVSVSIISNAVHQVEYKD